MSGLRRAIRHPDRSNDPHARVHSLASDQLLEPIDPDDAAWLDAHLERCAGCRQFVTEISADRELFAGLRDAPPATPRDLGARLAGALDLEVQAAIRAGRRIPGRRPVTTSLDAARDAGARKRFADERARASRVRSGPRSRGTAGRSGTAGRRSPSVVFAGVAAAAVVALLVVPVLTGPTGSPSQGVPGGTPVATVAANPGPTPMRVEAGSVSFVQRGADGRYSLANAPVDQVCPGSDATACGTLDDTARTIMTLDIIEPSAVLLATDGGGAVVVGRDGVYAVSMPDGPRASADATASPMPDPTSSPVASPARTGAPASPPVGTPVPTGSPDSSAPPATPAAEPTPTASAAVAGSPDPSPSLVATVQPTPAVSPAEASPTPSPGDLQTATPEATPGTGTPAPDATPTPQPDSTPTPPPSPAPSPDVTIPPATPAPTAARTLAIAEGVVVMGAAAAYSPDGAWVAFSARPADGSGGPDVYAWRVGARRATALTDDGVSQFAGWNGDRLVISRVVVEGKPATADSPAAQVVPESRLVDPATGNTRTLGGQAWRPVVDPTHEHVAFWRGTFAWSPGDRAWMPHRGRLVIGNWAALRDGSGDTATDVPWSGTIADSADWSVRWNSSGERLAVWIADGQDQRSGRLSLFGVDPDGTLSPVVVKEAAALSSFSLDSERLAWATPPGKDGEGSRLSVYAWTANGDGQVESNPNADGILVAP